MATVIPAKIDEFNPDLVVYVAGADPYKEDVLGGLQLTKEGLRKRDEMVVNYCVSKNLPLVILLAGGYARDINDTVAIQATTCKVGIKGFK
jgi:acetoin utilization deacetylase AcuC-like enzyme